MYNQHHVMERVLGTELEDLGLDLCFPTHQSYDLREFPNVFEIQMSLFVNGDINVSLFVKTGILRMAHGNSYANSSPSLDIF